MATQLIRHRFWDIAELQRWVANDILYWNTFLIIEGFAGPVFGVTDGYRSVTYSYSSGEDEYIHTYSMMTLGAEETVPPRYLLRCPGFAGIRATVFDDTETYFPTWNAIALIFEVFILDLLISIINEWTTGFAEDYTPNEIFAAGDTIKSYSVVVPVITDTEVMSFTATIQGTAYVPEEGMDYQTIHPGPEIAGIGNSPDYGTALFAGRSAKALEEISMTRLEIGVNNGDAMFNIVGGSRFNTPG